METLAGLILTLSAIALFAGLAWICATHLRAGYSLDHQYRGDAWRTEMDNTWSLALGYGLMALIILAALLYALLP